MKKGRFLWSAHRITERQKAGKARSIKGKQLKNSRNTVSKQLVEHHSSLNDNLERSDNERKQSFFEFVFEYRNLLKPRKALIFRGFSYK